MGIYLFFYISFMDLVFTDTCQTYLAKRIIFMWWVRRILQYGKKIKVDHGE